MSEDSSKKPVTKSVTKAGSKVVPWGPIPAIIVSFMIFLVPQFLMAAFFQAIKDSAPGFYNSVIDSDSVAITFALVGITELISMGLLLWYFKFNNFKLSDLRLKPQPRLKQMLVALPAFGLYFILSSVILYVTTALLPNINLNQEQVVGFENAGQTYEIILAFVALVIVAPFVEEIIFRGFLFQGLRSKLTFGWAAVISSALFGLAHGQLNVGLDVFALGLVLCWLLEDTKSLWPSILLHALKNTVAFVILFFVNVPTL